MARPLLAPGYRSGVEFLMNKRAMAKQNPTPPTDRPRIKNIAQNRKARHDYHVLETIEAGIELVGTEVKSLRAGRANLTDSFGKFEGSQLYVYQLHISPYEQGNRWNVEPARPRRLLLHKNELLRWMGKVAQKGLTIVPLQMYFKGSRVKLEIGLCQGKKLYDKRETMKLREQDREMQRAMKQYKM